MKDSGHMVLYCLVADSQFGGDFFIAHASGDILKDLHLARREWCECLNITIKMWSSNRFNTTRKPIFKALGIKHLVTHNIETPSDLPDDIDQFSRLNIL
jgi:hypothetical protein